MSAEGIAAQQLMAALEAGSFNTSPAAKVAETWLNTPRFVRMDVFGRIYLDECRDDLQHLTKPAEDGVRTHCRWYLDKLLEPLVGKRVKVIGVQIKYVEIPEGEEP